MTAVERHHKRFRAQHSLQGKAFLSLRDFKPPLCRAINSLRFDLI